jgi:hypothetical protein
MILVDFSQVLVSNMAMQGKDLNEDLARHSIIMTLLSFKKKFGSKYGEMILAMDSRNYWRRDIYPGYKKHREEGRKSSSIDWNELYRIGNILKEEFKENLRWKIIEVEKVEADDIIAIYAMKYCQEPTIIISSDEDFKQLQINPHITQWSSIGKKYVTSPDPEQDLLKKIISGDSGDTIANILSPIDCKLTGVRQKPLTAKRMKELINNPALLFQPEYKERFLQNRDLIDFNKIPSEVINTVSEAIEKVDHNKSQQKLFKYFVKNRLSKLIEEIQHF